MMRIVIIVLLGLSLIFAIVGTITNRWYQNTSDGFNEGLWLYCQQLPTDSSSSSSATENLCHKQPYLKSQALAIVSVILLSIAFVLSIAYFYQKRAVRPLVYVIIAILATSTLLLIFSYLLYRRNAQSRQLGYSIYLMVSSSIIVLICTALITFLAKTVQPTPISITLT